MSKKPAAYYRPAELAEALRLLAEPDTVPLAGGTTLLADEISSAVVDLQDLGLAKVERAEGRLRVGAMCRLADLATAVLADSLPDSPAALLQTAIGRAGPNTLRNAATIGGIIASRQPDSELLAALLVLDARLTLYDPEARRISLADYLAADERPSGLITAVSLAWESGRGGSERVARTPADAPIVSVTAWQGGGQIGLAATGVAQQPLRLTVVEAVLADGLTGDIIPAAAEAARQTAVHPGDFRGDAAYRAEMAVVLTQRLLTSL